MVWETSTLNLPLLPDIDRQNLSASKLQGILTALDMDLTQFATAVAILFVGYLPFQIPSNLIVSQIPRPGLCRFRQTFVSVSLELTDARYLLRMYGVGRHQRIDSCCTVLQRFARNSGPPRYRGSRILPR